LGEEQAKMIQTTIDKSKRGFMRFLDKFVSECRMGL
jgi:hypothetical protein